MLVLSRKEGEGILIGGTRIVVQKIRGQRGNLQVVLGIEAPDDVLVLREEIADRNQEQADGADPDGAGEGYDA